MLFIGFSFADPNIQVLQRLARLSGRPPKGLLGQHSGNTTTENGPIQPITAKS